MKLLDAIYTSVVREGNKNAKTGDAVFMGCRVGNTYPADEKPPISGYPAYENTPVSEWMCGLGTACTGSKSCLDTECPGHGLGEGLPSKVESPPDNWLALLLWIFLLFISVVIGSLCAV